MQLQLSTWQEIELYLERSKGIVIPIGSTEQHGPTGMIGTDALCPEIIAKAAGDTADLLVAPTFNVGIAQHHMGFAGSMTLRPSTFIAALVDWVASLAHHGFTRIYFLNGHGGNNHTINAAFAEIYTQASLGGGDSAVRCTLANWWDLGGVMDFCKKTYPKGHGAHATPSEVAVTYFAYQNHIKNAPLDPKIAPWGRYTDATSYREAFPDGRMGSDPSLATIEDGEKLVNMSAKGLIEDFGKFAAS